MNSYDAIISSISNEKIKRIRAMALKKNRDAEVVFVVEGAAHVQKALEHGFQVETLLFTQDAKTNPAMPEIVERCRAQNATMLEISDKVASYASNRDNAQAVIAVFEQRYHNIEIVKNAGRGIWLGLENVRDPGNLGTIIRTADAVGSQGVILIGNTCDAFSPEVVRASTGSFSAVPLVQISLETFLSWRVNFTGTIVGTHLHIKAIDYRELKTQLPALLLMGGEQAGLSTELVEVCDIVAKIPMRDGVESLNLAVSAAIILYQFQS